MLNYNANYTDQQEASNGEENSKKFDSFESEESSEFDSGIYFIVYYMLSCIFCILIAKLYFIEEYNENSKSN